ncbi:hypothetical protein AN214_01562 [Pseudoalteromonas sp. P1-9]|uniref:hypothetical protein n=1 Tax=Pseudoalteromonas sp. P1-9 TaxID=1710354 RepID=UPI0006D60462|nr:hypothetical protein [Pseudoalteromonas sp. P1-9]KPV96467.1 hypothetical protein AN214_01562 [Pseudoalteromonas sp. P1-9]
MKYLILSLSLFLTACNSTTHVDVADTMDLIAQAEDNAPDGVEGTFKFLVKATGSSRRGEVYLNTEHDYRDRRAVTIVLSPSVVPEFTKNYGKAPNAFFTGKVIEVTGEAKREIIDFVSNGKRTGKYYFQTHIRVSSLEQIKVLS